MQPDQTLVVPTYTPRFAVSQVFDRRRSEATTGVLPNRVRARANARRTDAPMNSYAVVGPLAGDMLAQPQMTAWGDDSVMGWLERVNARVVVLGISWGKGCGLLHRPEEQQRVPYRYFKVFRGTLLDDGEPVGPCQETQFVRPRGVPLVNGYEAIDPVLAREPHHRRIDTPNLFAASVPCRTLMAVGRQMLADNLYAFTGNPEALAAWVQDRKAKEVEALPAENRP